MRISKVYTRTGDSGKTRLAGGQEVWKDSLRVDVYGTVDELNSIIGLVRVFNGDTVGRQTHATRLEDFHSGNDHMDSRRGRAVLVALGSLVGAGRIIRWAD